jgi:hypothetical protein
MIDHRYCRPARRPTSRIDSVAKFLEEFGLIESCQPQQLPESPPVGGSKTAIGFHLY